MSSPRVVVVIPARYGSTRLPGKPLVQLAGQPMIQRVYERAKGARRVDQVIVATDDERISKAVQGFGGEARMTRADHRTGTERVAEVAAHIKGDVFVNVQGDEPLLDPDSVDTAVGALLEYPTLPQGELERIEQLEQLRWLENGWKIRVAEVEHDAVSVDVPEDLARVEKMLGG